MDTDAAMCPICWDTIYPCQEVVPNDCFLERLFHHIDCHNAWLRTVPLGPYRCLVCRQFVITGFEWIDLSTLFGYAFQEYELIEELPSAEAQCYARRVQRGEITSEQLRAEAHRKRIEITTDQLRAEAPRKRIESTAPQSVPLAQTS